MAAPMPKGLLAPVTKTTLFRKPGSIMPPPATSTDCSGHSSAGKS
jgi:hypothetical protein